MPNHSDVTSDQNRAEPRRSFFWPILLISLGVLFLLSNLEILPWSTWNVLWRFWPVLLIAIGIDVLIGQRSPAGAVISAVLILALLGGAVGLAVFADQIPLLNGYTKPAEWQEIQLEEPLGEYRSASVIIDYTSLPGRLESLQSSNNLIEADLVYQGELVFDVDQQDDRAVVKLDTRSSWTGLRIPSSPGPNASWDIGLSPGLPLYLTLDSGSGSCQFDLTELQIANLVVDSGSGSIALQLPGGLSFPAVIDSGSGSVRIDIPADTGVRVTLDSGSGAFRPGEQLLLISGERRGDGTWETENYLEAEHQIELKIDQGSGSVTIQ